MTLSEAIKKLFEETCIETILNTYDDPQFFEFVGECGDDVYRYRVYKNSGIITEK